MSKTPTKTPTKMLYAGAALAALSPLAVLSLRAAHAQGTAMPPAAAPPAATPGQSVTLRYKFVPGQVRRYKMSMTMSMTMIGAPQGMPGAGTPMTMATQMTMRQTVKSVRPSDGAATLAVQIGNIRTAMNGKEMPMGETQQSAMRKPFTLMMLPTGKLVSVTAPANTMPGMDMGQSLSGLNVSFPDGPVKAGDTWKGTAALPLPGGMGGLDLTLDSALASLSGDGTKANVAQKIGGTMDVNASKGMPAGMKMAGTISGTNGMVFDSAAGAVQSQATDMLISMNMTFTPKPGQAVPQGMPTNMQMQMRQHMVMERLPDAAPVATAPVQ